MATTCSGVVPHKIIWESSGPTLRASPFYYDFDGSTTDGNWPAHDPCKVDGQNHEKGASNLGGQVYLR